MRSDLTVYLVMVDGIAHIFWIKEDAVKLFEKEAAAGAYVTLQSAKLE